MTSGATFGTFSVRVDDVLVDMSHAESTVAENIQSTYGIRAAVTCGAPRLRRFAVGQHATCAMRGHGLPDEIEFKVADAEGDLFVYNVPHLKAVDVMTVGPYLTLFQQGRPVIVPGTRLAEIVRRVIVATGRPGSPASLLNARCPGRADLSNGRRVTCVVTTADGVMLYDAWIDHDGFQVRSRRGLAEVASIQATAEHYYEDQLAAAGLARHVSVDCGPKRMISLDRNTKVMCSLDVGDGTRPLTITFPTYPSGYVYYHVGPARTSPRSPG